MTAALLLPVMEREHPRLTSAEIDDRFLIEDFKVKPCPFGAGCKQGPAKCPFLHPGEKGRRDLRRLLYSSRPCKSYSLNSGSCPGGDGCSFAHGFLERRFHPSRYSYKILNFLDLEEYLKEEDILDEVLKKGGLLHPQRADACERNAIDELILNLKSNGYKPYDTQQVDACVPDSFNNVASNELAVARTVSDVIFKRYTDINIVTGGTFNLPTEMFPP